MNRLYQATLTLFLAVFIISAFNSCKQPSSPPAIDVNNMNFNYAPGDEFYRFVNDGWLQNNPMPDEYSRYGSFEKLAEENEEKLYDLLVKNP